MKASDLRKLTPDELGYGAHGDSFEEMTPFAKDSGWTLPYLYDGETQTLSMAVGAQSTPHVFVFGQDRKLAYTGRMDDAARKTGPGRLNSVFQTFRYPASALPWLKA